MEIIEILNPWWKEGEISRELALPYKRKIIENILTLMDKRQITIITGLRRTGKSTILYQLIEYFLNKEINPKNILYFSFDEKLENPLELLDKYQQLTKVNWRKEKCFLLFDEMQKLESWSSKLKLIYDSFPNLKIIISGSSSFQLEKDAKSNLVGRHFVVNINPLSFLEYLELTKSEIDLSKPELWENEIKKEFKEYLFRSFPEAAKLNELSLVKIYIKDAIIDKVLKADLIDKFKNINENLLTILINIFFNNPGTYINYDSLSNELKISKKTLMQHVFYLEFAYVIRIIKNFRPRTRTSSRKLQRAYPYHWSLEFGWSGKISSETVVATLLNAKYYWRRNGDEVDFLVVDKKILPVEVKESFNIETTELRSLIKFMKESNLKEGLLVYNGIEEETNVEDYIIKKIPIWKLALNDTIKQGS